MFLSLTFSGQSAPDSTNKSLNNITFNILGEGSLSSVNFERMMQVGKYVVLSAKLGLGVNADFCGIVHCEENYKGKMVATIPHHFTANFGKGRAFFEAGYSGTYFAWNYQPKYIPSLMVAFRSQSISAKGFVFRTFVQIPLIKADHGLHYGEILFIPVGLSLGFSF